MMTTCHPDYPVLSPESALRIVALSVLAYTTPTEILAYMVDSALRDLDSPGETDEFLAAFHSCNQNLSNPTT